MVNSEWVGREYVAMGSSFAAGPGIGQRVQGAPKAALRSRTNYAHLLADALELTLSDVTYSGAATANLLDEPMSDQPPQLHALQASTDLVTITIGGNDLGYVGTVVAAALARPLRRLPWIAKRRRETLEISDVDARLATAQVQLNRVASQARERAPHARIIFVDYLTLLSPARLSSPMPLPASIHRHDAELVQRLEEGLEQATAQAASDNGCELVAASVASREHDPFSATPWASGPVLRPGGAPFHPNQAGMSAIASLLKTHLSH